MLNFGLIRQNVSDQKANTKILFSDWQITLYANGTLLYGDKKATIPFAIKTVSSDNKRVFILSDDGVLHSFCKNTGLLKTLKFPRAQTIASNYEGLFLITNNQNVITVNTIGLEDLHPENDCFLMSHVKRVACGAGFTLFLMVSGQVLSQGLGSRGQLGHGDLENRTVPTIIEGLESVTVLSIACGYWHAACLSDGGDVYCWGSNEWGQTGQKSLNLERSRHNNDPCFSCDDCVNIQGLPCPLDVPNDDLISEIACGSRHTVCLSETHKLYAFGWNGFGQLGYEPLSADIAYEADIYPHLTSSDQLTEVVLPEACKNITSISCGTWSTLAYFEKA